MQPVRHIKPMGPRILVRVCKAEDRSNTGLYLPAGAKEEHDDAIYAEVVEVARAEDSEVGLYRAIDDESDHRGTLGHNVSGVPLGAMILMPKRAGVRVPWDEQLRLIEVRDVLATVEEIEPENVQ